jgi:hypothetical protein
MLLQYGKFDDWLIIVSRISNSKKKILNNKKTKNNK